MSVRTGVFCGVRSQHRTSELTKITRWTSAHQQKPMCHLNLGNLMYVQSGTLLTANIEILECKGNLISLVYCGRWLLELVGLLLTSTRVCCSDWRGWFRVGLPFFRGRRLLPFNFTHPEYPITPEALSYFFGAPELKIENVTESSSASVQQEDSLATLHDSGWMKVSGGL
ncbi:hypothetical protein J6590_048891, partial [Homalodisca vitripennis]